MQYEPIKKSMGRFFSGPVFMRKLLYFLVDLLLLRTWHIKKALREIRTELPPDASILDAGSGMGQYAWRMSKMCRQWKISGIDINNEEVDSCNDFFKRARLADRVTFRCADLSRFSEPLSFDLVLSVDVMEHILEDEQVFRNFHQSLRTNGIVLISTPSNLGGSDVHDEGDESFIGEHVRNGYGAEEIRTKLANAGFEDIDVSYTYGKPGSVSWLLAMKYPIRLLNRSKLFFLLLPIYYLPVFPVSLILNYFDVRLKHSEGTGLLVKARKR
jgi:SAM-dependent methyltransferase